MATGYSTVVDILVSEFRCAEEELSPDSTMENVDLDSLAQVEFAVALENRSGRPFSEDQLTLDTTLGEIAAFLDAAPAVSASHEK
ncbi:acyl carrier protein [Streptomyces sp. BG9H]|uniref:Acyl carrier protein n=1 Tax=Streptomyces anatolicus TaxID=2675858 RepID=A0ABS6YL89_9ACTN|nr:acyl carrier protein [Streptomyces anatolicus]MBW5421331.1 acyl carrier protein [Streptomyces anatolicus]